MSRVSLKAFCEALYCAYTPRDAFEIGPDGRITFTASSTHDAATVTYQIEFAGVRDLTWTDEGQNPEVRHEPDYRLELSVVEVEHKGEEWRVWFNPWYVHEVEFLCARIRINGAEVVGEGSWLQDDLPVERPAIPDTSARVV